MPASISKPGKSKRSAKSTDRALQRDQTDQSRVDKCFQIPDEFEPKENKDDDPDNKKFNNKSPPITPASTSTEFNTIIGTNTGGNLTVNGSVNITIGLLAPPPAVAPGPVIIKTFRMVDTATPSFSGRDVLLQKIHARITHCATNVNWYERVVVLHGLGGMGKSELARKYASLHIDLPFIRNIAWINAESEKGLRASFMALADKLGLSLSLSSPDASHQHPTKDISQAIYEHFSNYIQKGLLIFDNAEQMNSQNGNFGLFDYLPTQHLEVTPLIILTSRANEWDSIPLENIIHVRELSDGAAVKLLEKRLEVTEDQRQSDKDMAAVKRLSSALQSFPLAIILSASNIHNSDWSELEKDIEVYLERMAGQPKDDSKLSPDKDTHWMDDEHSAGSASKYNLIMSKVWSVTFTKIKSSGAEGETALKLMYLMAYLPSHSITFDGLNAIFQFVCDDPNPPQAMSYHVLEKYSIISIRKGIGKEKAKEGDMDADTDTEVYRILIHRLVQQCTIKELDFKKDHSYLVRLSNYMTAQQEIDPFMEELEQLHKYLRGRNWPGNSIEASILLLAYRINRDDEGVGLGQALDILNDIAPFLQRTLKSTQSAVELFPSFPVGTLFLELFHSVIFYLRSKFYALPVRDKDVLAALNDPIFGQDKCREYVVTSLIHYVEHSVAQDLELDGAHRLRDAICEQILYFKPEIVNEGRTVEVRKVILAALSSTTCKRLDTTGGMMRLLWDFSKDNLILEYVTIVCQKHLEVYPNNPNSTDQSSNSKAAKEITKYYWGKSGPLRVHDLLSGFHSVRSRSQETNKTAKSKELTWEPKFQKNFVETFLSQGGCKILSHHIRYYSTLSEIPHQATVLLKFMSYLGFHWNCADEFTRTEGFMDNLVQFLKTSLKLKKFEFVYEIRFWSLITWLGIFSKTKTISHQGKIWAINSMAAEMGEMYREMNLGIGLWEGCWVNEWWSERYIEILNEFLKNHTDGGVGVESAKILITILNRKYLGLYQRKLTTTTTLDETSC